MFLKKIFLLFISLVCLQCYSQNNIGYSNYGYSLNLIDPSFSGQKEGETLLINSKIQWMGVNQPPVTHTLAYSMPLKNNLGLGFSILNDKVFLFNETTISVDGSYKLKLNETHNLKFGLRVQGNIYSGDLSKVTTRQSNDHLYTNTKTRFNPNFSMGASIDHKDYYTHLVVNKILKDRRHSNIHYSGVVNHYNIMLGGGYTFMINDEIDIIPSTLFRFYQGSVLEFDLNTRLRYKKKYNLGLSCFWHNSFQVNGLIDVSTWARVGYGHRFYTNDLGINYGTHEFMLLFDLDKASLL